MDDVDGLDVFFLYFLWVKQIVGSVHPDLIPKKSQEKVPKKSLTFIFAPIISSWLKMHASLHTFFWLEIFWEEYLVRQTNRQRTFQKMITLR